MNPSPSGMIDEVAKSEMSSAASLTAVTSQADKSDPVIVVRDSIAAVTQPLQRALENILSLAGGACDSATEVARYFKIEQTLAWRVWRLVYASTGEEATQFVIGSSALESFLTASERRGADAALLETVRRAHQDYRDFVIRFAGDDATLRMMLAPLSDNRPGAALSESKILFDAHRLRVGVQSSVQLRSIIYHPGSRDDAYSTVTTDVFHDVWWLRSNGKAVLGTKHFIDRSENAEGAMVKHTSTPIDPELAARQAAGETIDVPLLHKFCIGKSTTLSANYIGATTVFEMAPLAVGKDRAGTITMAHVQRDCYPEPGNRNTIGFSRFSLVPAEILIAEVYLPKEWMKKGYLFHPQIHDSLFWPNTIATRAYIVDLAALGGVYQIIDASANLTSPAKLPFYRDLLTHNFAAVGLRPEDYACCRIRLNYPPMGMLFSLNGPARDTD